MSLITIHRANAMPAPMTDALRPGMARDACSCRAETRRHGRHATGWAKLPPCPACAAWGEGWVLISGVKTWPRELWTWENQED